MPHVVELTRDELLERRRRILDRYNLSLDEISERAKSFSLVGDEWDAWEDLNNIAFLLGDDCP